jgi:hypothetical protein
MKPTGCIASCYCSSLNTAEHLPDGTEVKNRFQSTVVTKHLERGYEIYVDYQFVEVVFQVIANNLHDDIGDGR